MFLALKTLVYFVEIEFFLLEPNGIVGSAFITGLKARVRISAAFIIDEALIKWHKSANQAYLERVPSFYN